MASASPPRKRQKPKYDCKYSKEYEKLYKFIQPSKNGDLYAFCTYCKSDIKIAHGGKNDLKHHIGSDKHKRIARSIAGTPGIAGHFLQGELQTKVSDRFSKLY